MRFRDAERLHNGDEVILKADGEPLYVVDAWVDDGTTPPSVLIQCADGNTYHHTEVR